MTDQDPDSPFKHDEDCEICGSNAPKNDRLTRLIPVAYGQFYVCRVCEPKLPREWQHDPESAIMTFKAQEKRGRTERTRIMERLLS